MKVIFLMVTFFLLNVGIFGSGVTYLIADGSLGTGDIYIKGLKGNGDILEEGEVAIERVKTYNYKDSDNTDVEAGLFKISVDDGGSGSKIVVGYELGGKYILLSTREAKGEENISNNYDAATGAEDYLGLIDPQDYIDEKIFYAESPYERFPGHEVDEGRVIMGVRVGEEEMEAEGRTEPSNIVEKFFTEKEERKKVKIEAGINPNNSPDNEFIVTDSEEKVVIEMKKDVKIWDSSGSDGGNKKGKKTDVVDDSGLGGLKDIKGQLKSEDKIEVSDGILKFGEKEIGKGPFKISIRIQNKLSNNEFSEVEIDSKPIKFSGETKNYNLEDVSKFKVTYSGKGNKFDFFMDDKDNEDVIIKDGGSTEEADVVYVIEGVGTKYEGSVVVESSSEDSGRQRVSDVQIEILGGSGGIDIKKIAE